MIGPRLEAALHSIQDNADMVEAVAKDNKRWTQFGDADLRRARAEVVRRGGVVEFALSQSSGAYTLAWRPPADAPIEDWTTAEPGDRRPVAGDDARNRWTVTIRQQGHDEGVIGCGIGRGEDAAAQGRPDQRLEWGAEDGLSRRVCIHDVPLPVEHEYAPGQGVDQVSRVVIAGERVRWNGHRSRIREPGFVTRVRRLGRILQRFASDR